MRVYIRLDNLNALSLNREDSISVRYEDWCAMIPAFNWEDVWGVLMCLRSLHLQGQSLPCHRDVHAVETAAWGYNQTFSIIVLKSCWPNFSVKTPGLHG